jgi:hypothetical protein
VYEDDRLARSLVDVVVSMPLDVQPVTLEGIEMTVR